jgi:Putative beta-lactamase-inhibitor-like, PepSY-like
MKKYFIATVLTLTLFTSMLFAQGKISVPKAVKAAFAQKYPKIKGVKWEKEKGNYEANWGGKSREDSSALFAPSGQFIEIAKAISVKQLPASALSYVKTHYKGSSINEAALVTDAKGKISYEAEVNHKDVVFDEHGNFLKTDKK